MRKSSSRDCRSRESISIFFSEERTNVLTTKSRIDAHDQNMMNQGKNFIEAVDRCGGVDDHAGFATMRSNETKGTIEMTQASWWTEIQSARPPRTRG